MPFLMQCGWLTPNPATRRVPQALKPLRQLYKRSIRKTYFLPNVGAVFALDLAQYLPWRLAKQTRYRAHSEQTPQNYEWSGSEKVRRQETLSRGIDAICDAVLSITESFLLNRRSFR